MQEYACFSFDQLSECIIKIQKRLGNDHTKLALEALTNGDYSKVAEITLQYYDKAYKNQLTSKQNESIIHFSPKSENADEIAREILDYIN